MTLKVSIQTWVPHGRKKGGVWGVWVKGGLREFPARPCVGEFLEMYNGDLFVVVRAGWVLPIQQEAVWEIKLGKASEEQAFKRRNADPRGAW